MHDMLHELQLGKLDLLMAQRPEDHQFANDVALVKQEVPADETHEARETRVEAENRVKAVVMEAGERVFHGDLLTFQKLTAARLVGAPCVRALDRFEFLGPCRMQLFHLVMNMRGVDALAAMPDPAGVEDRPGLAHILAVTGINKWFSNKRKKVLSNYEPHHQHLRCFQGAFAVNMWDNYVSTEKLAVSQLRTTESVLAALHSMMEHYGALLWWDPEYVDPLADGDSLLLYGRDQVIRLVLTLAFSQAEHNNDAMALRALRRTSVPFFLAHSSKSKYALHLLIDLVIELGSSERTRARMDNTVCVNVSGVRGGYMFRYIT